MLSIQMLTAFDNVLGYETLHALFVINSAPSSRTGDFIILETYFLPWQNICTGVQELGQNTWAHLSQSDTCLASGGSGRDGPILLAFPPAEAWPYK